MKTVVHVTHEAVVKVGGIGAVLEGLLTSHAYQKDVSRTILIQPLFTVAGSVDERLGPDGEVLYSSLDGRRAHEYGPAFDRICNEWNVEIVYGHRVFGFPGVEMTTNAEVILIDVTRMDVQRINQVKARLWSAYELASDRYEMHWDFDQYVKLAGPALDCLGAIGAARPARRKSPDGPALKMSDDKCVIVAHEFMGMPTALLGGVDEQHDYRTVFYAHEVATMRRLVENNPGHDTMFYNVLSRAIEQELYVEDVFGDQQGFFKHPLVDRARHCDNVLAVGDYVIKELRFMGAAWEQVPVDLSYNGIPAHRVSLADKLISRSRLQEYTSNLLGYEPDVIFSHVTRMALSKALWRDLKVLSWLDAEFMRRGQRGVLLVLSIGAAPRRPDDIREMERKYGWPVAHREGGGDMTGSEADYYVSVQRFNARSRNIKAVFINQFGFGRDLCGRAVPSGSSTQDLRVGVDCEFGLSIYEPFGIAMLEPLTYGGLCVVSSVCGCKGFLDDVTGGAATQNVIVADYTDLDGHAARPLASLMKIDGKFRGDIEDRISRQVAEQLAERLPKSDADRERLLASGYELASRMSWDVVAQDYFLPALARACHATRRRDHHAAG